MGALRKRGAPEGSCPMAWRVRLCFYYPGRTVYYLAGAARAAA